MRIDALASRPGDRDTIDLRRIGVDAHIARHPDAGEMVILKDGFRSLRLDVRSGTFCEGPVRLRYALEGMRDLGHQLLTLRRLLGLRRLGRFPAALFSPERRVPRWILILRAFDAVEAGASHRDIAAALFGVGRVRADWRGQSDYLRLRVQRLVRLAASLVDRGYLAMLRNRPPL